jgi:predicted SnoaL-like aldol condensation-catalyzing enzyme
VARVLYTCGNTSARGTSISGSQQQSISEENKRLIHRWFEEVWSQGRRETIYELFAPEGVIHDGLNTYRGPEEFTRFYDGVRSEFTDICVTPTISLSEGDLACVRWSVTCRHIETGKAVQLTGISIVRIKNGQVIEGWQNWDAAGGRHSGEVLRNAMAHATGGPLRHE